MPGPGTTFLTGMLVFGIGTVTTETPHVRTCSVAALCVASTTPASQKESASRCDTSTCACAEALRPPMRVKRTRTRDSRIYGTTICVLVGASGRYPAWNCGKATSAVVPNALTAFTVQVYVPGPGTTFLTSAVLLGI